MWNKVLFFLIIFYSGHPATAQNWGSWLPNPRITPGETIEITAADLCELDYKNPARKISMALKSRVFDRYRIGRDMLGYKVDQLIPASLGGSNSMSNLWPQPLSGDWNWHRKNKLERRLRKLVCRGQLDLKTAQQEIATDWVSAYKKYLSDPGQSGRSSDDIPPTFDLRSR